MTLAFKDKDPRVRAAARKAYRTIAAFQGGTELGRKVYIKVGSMRAPDATLGKALRSTISRAIGKQGWATTKPNSEGFVINGSVVKMSVNGGKASCSIELSSHRFPGRVGYKLSSTEADAPVGGSSAANIAAAKAKCVRAGVGTLLETKVLPRIEKLFRNSD
jgi:hypothetical protein